MKKIKIMKISMRLYSNLDHHHPPKNVRKLHIKLKDMVRIQLAHLNRNQIDNHLSGYLKHTYTHIAILNYRLQNNLCLHSYNITHIIRAHKARKQKVCLPINRGGGNKERGVRVGTIIEKFHNLLIKPQTGKCCFSSS